MRVSAATTTTTVVVALAAASLMMMLDRIFGLLPAAVVPTRAFVRMDASTRYQALRKASRGQSFRSLGSLHMAGERLVGSSGGTTKNVPAVMDTFRPRSLLRQCINDAPREPGVYIMESAEGRKLYIGKSIKLSSRVPTYFGSSSSSGGVDRSGGELPLPAVQDAAAAVVLPGGNLSRRIAVMTTLVER